MQASVAYMSGWTGGLLMDVNQSISGSIIVNEVKKGTPPTAWGLQSTVTLPHTAPHLQETEPSETKIFVQKLAHEIDNNYKNFLRVFFQENAKHTIFLNIPVSFRRFGKLKCNSLQSVSFQTKPPPPKPGQPIHDRQQWPKF